MAQLRQGGKEAARWRQLHRSGTATLRRTRDGKGVELMREPKVDDAPPEVVVRALFTKETLADYLQVSVYTVQRLVQDGVLIAIKVGNQVRFHADDVDRFLDQCRTGAKERTEDRRG